MGGHGDAHIEGNHNNIQEEDSTISHKIRSIELIKHNPQLFHFDPWSVKNQYEIIGGTKTLAFGVIGGWIYLTYFLGRMKTRPYNFYDTLHLSS